MYLDPGSRTNAKYIMMKWSLFSTKKRHLSSDLRLIMNSELEKKVA